MTRSTKSDNYFFHCVLAAVAMIGPMLLVLAAGTMPPGPHTGKFVVYGHGVVLGVLAAALVMRAAYAWGFRTGSRLVAANPNWDFRGPYHIDELGA